MLSRRSRFILYDHSKRGYFRFLRSIGVAAAENDVASTLKLTPIF